MIQKCGCLLFLSFTTFTYCEGQKNVSIGGGTCVIAFFTNDSVIIAADSRYFIKSDFGRRIVSSTIRKIELKNNIFFAFSGLTEVYDSGVKKFDVQDIFKNSMSVGIQLNTLSTSFNYNLNNAINQMVERKYLNKEFLLDSLPGKLLLQIVAVRFNQKYPDYLLGDYFIERNNLNQLFVKFIQEKPFTTESFYKAGFRDHIELFLEKNPEFTKSTNNIKQKMVHLICIEAKEHPEVACPIDMVVIKMNTYKWLKRVKTCANIRNDR